MSDVKNPIDMLHPEDKLPPEVPADEAAENRLSTEAINAKLKALNIDPSELRPAALPEYDGSSDEHILAGGVSAGEALALYQAHYAQPDYQARGITVGGVSSAQIFPGRGKIWLPDLTSRDEARKHWRNESARLTRELAYVQGQLDLVKADLNRVYDTKNRYVAALRFVLFDHLEGANSPMREAFRKTYLDHPDTKMDAKTIERLVRGVSDEMADWMKARAESVVPKVRKKAKRKMVKAPRVVKKPARKAVKKAKR